MARLRPVSTSPAQLTPDPNLAVSKYRHKAAGYDDSAQRTMALRQRVVAMLDLAPGDTVVDIACGTGLSLPLLAQAVGPSGTVVGVEVSPDMLSLAHARVAQGGWANIRLIEAPAEEADLGAQFDAALFNYTHDVLQSPQALQRIFRHARPGARIALAGIKHPSNWLYPLRLYRLIKARPYVTTFAGLERPWELIEQYVADLQVTPVLLGTNYLARARARG